MVLKSSREEKRKEPSVLDRIAHWMYVHELQELLKQLDPNDMVIPNFVENIAIERDGKFYGFVDFLDVTIELSRSEDEDQEEGSTDTESST